MLTFIAGISIGMLFAFCLVAFFEKREQKNNYFIYYNDGTDEYELLDYTRRGLVIFTAKEKYLVEERYNLIMKRREGTPQKLSKK